MLWGETVSAPMAASTIRLPLLRVRLGRLDDARLAELAAAGDEQAFEALYDRHHRALLGFCRHMLASPEDGEDALQQTFLRAHRSLLSHGAPEDIRPWLFAIARNRCRTALAGRKTAAVPDDELEPATEGLGSAVERRADLRELLGDIARLPEDQRSALVLAELGDLSHAEIATVIEVPTTKVKALVHQARTRLIAERDARETPCHEVREQLATARGGELRRGPLRRHLKVCDGCREYAGAVKEQRAALGLVLPVLPSAGLKDAIFGAISGGGGGTAVAAGGAALSGGSTGLGLAAKGLGAKLAIGAAIAGGAGGGAVLVKDLATGPGAPALPKAAAAVPAAPTAAAEGKGRSAPATVLVHAGGGPSAEASDRAEHGRERARLQAARRDRRASARAEVKRDRTAQREARKRRRADNRAAAKRRRTALRQSRRPATPAPNAKTPASGERHSTSVVPIVPPAGGNSRGQSVPEPVATRTPKTIPAPPLSPGATTRPAKDKVADELLP
jgi:RNA polymerase sigma factor (sigma-70 family)